MTRARQAEFISELIEDAKANLLNKVELVPEEWGGIELRRWIADMFVIHYTKTLSPWRRADYKNEVLVRNLL